MCFNWKAWRMKHRAWLLAFVPLIAPAKETCPEAQVVERRLKARISDIRIVSSEECRPYVQLFEAQLRVLLPGDAVQEGKLREIAQAGLAAGCFVLE